MTLFIQSKIENLKSKIENYFMKRLCCRISRRFFYALLSAIALIVVALAVCLHIGLFDDNFRVVIAGRCYRSGQMSSGELRDVLRQNQIKCVINLRGAREKTDWYHDEAQVCQEVGCKMVDVKLQLHGFSAPDQLEKLVSYLKNEPYPMLLHCRSGADRTGLAAVLYLMIVEQWSLDSALASQLTWQQGHFRIGDAKVIDDFFKLYRKTSDGQPIDAWIKDCYPQLFLKSINVGGELHS